MIMRRIINKTQCVAGVQQNAFLWYMAEKRGFLRYFKMEMLNMNDFAKLVFVDGEY